MTVALDSNQPHRLYPGKSASISPRYTTGPPAHRPCRPHSSLPRRSCRDKKSRQTLCPGVHAYRLCCRRARRERHACHGQNQKQPTDITYPRWPTAWWATVGEPPPLPGSNRLSSAETTAHGEQGVHGSMAPLAASHITHTSSCTESDEKQGGMGEWTLETVLDTCVVHGTVRNGIVHD